MASVDQIQFTTQGFMADSEQQKDVTKSLIPRVF